MLLYDGFLNTKIMKLISMTDFVLKQEETFGRENSVGFKRFASNVTKYANFLKQPPKIEMFVPCDDIGSILQEPTFCEPNNENEIGNYQELRDEYELAKSKVLFEGFCFFNNNGDFWLKSEKSEIKIYWNTEKTKWYFADEDYRIEDLIISDLTLTQKGLNVLFGKAII